MQGSTDSWDLIVIGAGTTGLPAAIFASRRGARVLLIDAAGDIGGTLHLAHGQVSAAGTRLQVDKGIHDDPDAHFDDVMRISRGLADPTLIRRIVDEAPATIDWLLEAGLEPLAEHPVNGQMPGREGYSVPRYLWAADQGRSILAVLRRELQPELDSGRVELLLNTRVTDLDHDAPGRVTGVRLANGRLAHARHVLLATGGYAMNPELFQELCGCPAYAAGSYPYSQGDGLKLGMRAGGMVHNGHLHRPGSGSILDSVEFPARFYARFNTTPQLRAPWEVWVNDRGERFIREDEPDAMTREEALLAQPLLRYHVIFDRAILDQSPSGIPDWERSRLIEHCNQHPMFHSADSLELLANRAGINAIGLQATIDQYNRSVRERHDILGREHLPLTITQPPFYAITQVGHSAVSCAGLKVDDGLRVLDETGAPIPGLLAAGEILGSGATLGRAFVPGMMLTPALALGRWLGLTLTMGSTPE
ncbi:MAG: FAD-dependent oxidoreductase [Steroidobacteraceae bacterium]